MAPATASPRERVVLFEKREKGNAGNSYQNSSVDWLFGFAENLGEDIVHRTGAADVAAKPKGF
jgi:hypothetical protein